MTEIARLNRGQAKSNPRDAFADPMQIVDEVMLTRGEKRAALEGWRTDLLLELTASGEGMHTHGVSDRLSRQLRSVERALRELEVLEPQY